MFQYAKHYWFYLGPLGGACSSSGNGNCASPHGFGNSCLAGGGGVILRTDKQGVLGAAGSGVGELGGVASGVSTNVASSGVFGGDKTLGDTILGSGLETGVGSFVGRDSAIDDSGVSDGVCK